MDSRARRKQKTRNYKFDLWWNKNKKHQRATTWLVYHSKRIAFAYNLHSQAFDEIMFICKRYHLSQYKRLTKKDAKTLYRLVNPLPHERLGMITDEAMKLQQLVDELKQLKRSQVPITKKKTRSYNPDIVK